MRVSALATAPAEASSVTSRLAMMDRIAANAPQIRTKLLLGGCKPRLPNLNGFAVAKLYLVYRAANRAIPCEWSIMEPSSQSWLIRRILDSIGLR